MARKRRKRGCVVSFRTKSGRRVSFVRRRNRPRTRIGRASRKQKIRGLRRLMRDKMTHAQFMAWAAKRNPARRSPEGSRGQYFGRRAAIETAVKYGIASAEDHLRHLVANRRGGGAFEKGYEKAFRRALIALRRARSKSKWKLPPISVRPPK